MATNKKSGDNDNEDLEEVEILDNRVLEERQELDERRKLTSPNQVTDKDIFEVRTSHEDARKATQILAVAAVSFGACIYGTTIAFPAVASPSLKKSNGTAAASLLSSSSSSNDTAASDFEDVDGIAPLPFHIFPDDLAYVASIPAFGMLFGSLLAGPISNYIGRKWTYILGVCGTLSAGYVLIATAQASWMMLLGRFLHGAGVGIATPIATVYTMEIATPNLRGRLAAVPAVAGTLGILFCQIVGAFTDWKMLSIILASLNIPFLAALIFIPESPVYLITTNQIDRAHKVLRILRGPHWNVTAELTDIKNAQDGFAQDKKSVTLRDFMTRGVGKPFLIALALMFFMQFTGINVILQYTPEIFVKAGSTIDQFLATIIVGFALLMSNLLTVAVADKMPRRLMLLLSAFGISATLIGIGIFMHLKTLEADICRLENENSAAVAQQLAVAAASSSDAAQQQLESAAVDLTAAAAVEEEDGEDAKDCPAIYTDNLGWLPLLLAMLYIFFFNLGYGAMIWITVVEVLPQHVRTVAASLAGGFACLWSFLTSHTYRYLEELIAGRGVFWLYGAVSFLGLVFIALFVPETKGKTDAEIQNHFANRRRANSAKSPVRKRSTASAANKKPSSSPSQLSAPQSVNGASNQED